MKDIYFDNSSTSFPKAPNVGRAMGEFIENGAFNINRGSYEGAYEAGSAVLDTREMLKDLFNAPDSKNVVFTPSVTYSLNYFIKGFLKPNDHVLVTSVEHNAVMRPLVQMKELGLEFDVVPCDEEGSITADDFRKYIKENTKAIITTHASNVCGTIIPIEEIGALCKEKGLVYAVDTAQTAGILNIDMQKANIDFLAFTGHKGLLGPQGIGGFIIDDKLNEICNPYILGGTGSLSHSLIQPDFLPDKFESGTLNIPGIIGLYEGIKFIEKEGLNTIYEHNAYLRSYLINEISNMNNFTIYGDLNPANGTSCVSITNSNLDVSELSFILDSDYGISNRSGLHCAPLAHKTIGTYPNGTVRLSLGYFNTLEEIKYTVDSLNKINKLYK